MHPNKTHEYTPNVIAAAAFARQLAHQRLSAFTATAAIRDAVLSSKLLLGYGCGVAPGDPVI